MRKQRILVDVFYLHVAQTGIKTYIKSLCREIENQTQTSYEYVIVPDYHRIEKSTFFKGKTPKWKNILYQALYFFHKQFLLPILSVWYRADIVFSPDILSPVIARGKKISVLYDTFFWDSPEHYQRHWLKYYLFSLKMGLKRNAGLVSITEFSKKKIQRLDFAAKIPVEVAYPASTLTPKSNLSSEPLPYRYFLHVGVMEKRKNLTMLVEAFARLKKESKYADLKLVLVGQRGPRESLDDYDQILSSIQKSGLEQEVILPGYISEQELNRYFTHAEAYVFPSLNEGFGLPVLEAFSYGLPVIISNQGALTEVAGDAALILEENTPEQLKKALTMVLENPTLRAELSKKGKIRLTEFSTHKFFLLLESAFTKILNG